jgi:hypothetical protein
MHRNGGWSKGFRPGYRAKLAENNSRAIQKFHERPTWRQKGLLEYQYDEKGRPTDWVRRPYGWQADGWLEWNMRTGQQRTSPVPVSA